MNGGRFRTATSRPKHYGPIGTMLPGAVVCLQTKRCLT